MKHNPILQLLDSATDFRRMQDALEGGKGPVAAFGVAANAKAHLCCSLARSRQVLFVTATDTTASQLAESARLFGVRAELFLARETPLVYVHAVSGEQRTARIAALCALLSGEPCVISASASALMQALAPKSAFAASLRSLKVGETHAPRALMERTQESVAFHVRADTPEADFVALREARDATLDMPKLILPAVQVNIRAGALPAPESNGTRYLKIPLDTL